MHKCRRLWEWLTGGSLWRLPASQEELLTSSNSRLISQQLPVLNLGWVYFLHSWTSHCLCKCMALIGGELSRRDVLLQTAGSAVARREEGDLADGRSRGAKRRGKFCTSGGCSQFSAFVPTGKEANLGNNSSKCEMIDEESTKSTTAAKSHPSWSWKTEFIFIVLENAKNVSFCMWMWLLLHF